MKTIDVFKEVMQEDMEIVKCKELSNKYKITLSYNGMSATCELNKLCTPGNEKSLCMRVIDTAMYTMYADKGNYQEAKAWLDGERWNKSSDIESSCEYCEGNEPLYWKNNENNSFVDSKGEILVTVKDHTIRYKVKYCPNCGKKF